MACCYIGLLCLKTVLNTESCLPLLVDTVRLLQKTICLTR